MSLRRFLITFLCFGALASGSATLLDRWLLAAHWRSAPPAVRAEMPMGEFQPLIAKVMQSVPPDGNLLLFSELDPALLPYYLHPRKIWQMQSDPETNAFYMDLPPSHYPVRNPDSFRVDWHLYYSSENAHSGGKLVHVGRQEAEQ